MHEKEKDKNSKILFNFSSRFLFSIREHCIFPLEEKSKNRRRRRRRAEEKKGSSREGRNRARKKGWPGQDRRVIYLHEPNSSSTTCSARRACVWKTWFHPPPCRGTRWSGAGQKGPRRVKRCAGTRRTLFHEDPII